MKIKFKKEMIIEFDTEIFHIAQKLAELDNNEQAEFFNVFFEELRKRCGDECGLDRQLIAIDDSLTSSSKECFKYFLL